MIVPASVAEPAFTSVIATELATTPATVALAVAAAEPVTVTPAVDAPPLTVTAPFVVVLFSAAAAV